ncbi:hypothetical protein CCACVL1_06929 [Corchorus capsularis]|uniref:Protein kinase domain-containing protein n=1 Tax=Corchorus capsularis TaxID=210143 RepID=A0A1R3JB79_COCAP|nr:hypothetical protein CCACVL1_06929 [Corchorus capsularis]
MGQRLHRSHRSGASGVVFRQQRFGQQFSCGNLVSLVDNNKTVVSSCIQPSCSDVLSYNKGCFAFFSENRTSFPATIQQFYHEEYGHSKRSSCSSTFIFDPMSLLNPDMTFPNDITSHVPATLEWTNPCDLEAAQCQEADAEPGCTKRCGNVDFEFPFGIEAGCYFNDWFRVTCKKTANGQVPFLNKIDLELNSFQLFQGIVRVNHPVPYSNCHERGSDKNGSSVDLRGSPFYFSSIFNTFVSVGCSSMATISHSHNQTDTDVIGGCLLPSCDRISNNNIGSCVTGIPPGITSFVANMTQINSNGTAGSSNNRSCGSAFIMDTQDSLFDQHRMIIIPEPDVASRRTHVLTSLQWATMKVGLCDLNDGSTTSDIFCSSPNARYCWRNLSSTYQCICSNDDSNSFSTDVCLESNKCRGSPTYYRYCHMLCLHAPGNDCLNSTSCPEGYEYDNILKRCRPILSDSTQYHSKKHAKWAIIIGCSTSLVTLVFILGSLNIYKVLKRRRNIKLKRKYFKRNGGLLLQQQLFRNEGSNGGNIRFFTSKELKRATDYYNENRILGQGGQGTVYKGMLVDGSIVAIKKSKMVDHKKKKLLDEKLLEQFVNEVMILSQINHRNVVKLLGCCLETQFPLLVYEFIPNGTLSQLIHEHNEDFPLTWEMRLRIGTEIANALSYLHSAASVPIYHRDIKATNILLDDKYRAKVSDFGTSRSVALEQTHLTTRVQGTFGYLDPEYFRSNQFTDKSDVYSFGVVLVELLTGKKPVHSIQSEDEEARSLLTFFLNAMRENSLLDILDPCVTNDGPEEEIIAVAKLAKRCLNLNGKKRPTMKQVAMELELIRTTNEANYVVPEISEDEDSDVDDKTATWGIVSYSSTPLNSVTLPLLVSNNTC